MNFPFIKIFPSCLIGSFSLILNLNSFAHESTILNVDPSGNEGYIQMESQQIGIDFPGSVARTTFETTQYIENGGVAAGDVNGDGFTDVFFCGLMGESQLYLNRGDWSFENATAGLGGTLVGKYINAATFCDIDGDGDLDLFCGSLKGDDVYLKNDGSGEFSPSNDIQWKKSEIGGITSFAVADVDLDGDLDLYTSRYLNTIARDTLSIDEIRELNEPQIQLIREGKSASKEFTDRYTVIVDDSSGADKLIVYENGIHDVLYLNDGAGLLKEAIGHFSSEEGNQLETTPEDWGLTATFSDMDDDGDPDLYVCNDFGTPDRFWENDGSGHFKPVAKLALRRTSNSSMGVDFADINNDGHQDLFVVDMLSRSHTLRKRQMGEMAATKTSIGEIDNRPQIMQNTLFLNRGDDTWTEIAQFAGVKASEWSWSPIFTDVDLDGYEDLVITTGAIRDFMDADVMAEIKKRGDLAPKEFRERQSFLPRLPMRNFIFRNQGDLTFKDYTEKWGFSQANVSGGQALADFDNDGDLDIMVNNTGSLPEIFQNRSSNNRVSVRLAGPEKNTQGIGAKIELWVNGDIANSRGLFGGGTYASSSDAVGSFGFPEGADSVKLRVVWDDGKVSVLPNVQSNNHYLIGYDDSEDVVKKTENDPDLLIFEDVSHLLGHKHHEERFDDFALQPLLPNRLSQLGPGVTWYDLDGDGDDELFDPTGRGANLTVMANLGEDGFRKVKSIKGVVDQTTLLATPNRRGGSSFLLGISNYEDEQVMPVLPFAFSNENGWKTEKALPPHEEMTGALAQADIDGDGDLDLFIGGRTIPGQYPRSAKSYVYLNDNGSWVLDETQNAVFGEVGLVSGATFGDLDNDGDSDLVLACEWGPIRVFRNENGELVEQTDELSLSGMTGWWNGVALGDINNDGTLEIFATNWGRNSKYEGSYTKKKGPLEIYYGDLNGDGVKDIIEAHYDAEMQCTVPERGFSCSSRAMPFVATEMETFEGFGLASLQEIYGERLSETEKLEAKTLEHTVFFLDGEKYRSEPLPLESQLSTAFGICIGDMDGDGNDDVFLSQNFFATQIETPRNDGGRGIWLKGDGTGSLEAIPGHKSGVMVYGDQRGAALSDFNRDGRVDLAVAQNGAETKLFKNIGAKAGLRVRLVGDAANPMAVGAMMNLNFDDSRSASRSVSSGSGYWSQESAVHVFGLPSWPISISIRWPNGENKDYAIPAGDAGMELTVRFDGSVTVH